MSICVEYNDQKPLKINGLTLAEAKGLISFHMAMGADVWVSKDGVCYVSILDFPMWA